MSNSTGFQPEESAVLLTAQIISVIMSVLSILASVPLLLCLLHPRSSRLVTIGDGRFFIICLTIADLVTCIFILLGIVDQTGLISSPPSSLGTCNSSSICVTQAFITVVSVNSSYLWVNALQMFWFYGICKRRVLQPVHGAVKVVLVISSIALPLIIAIYGLAVSALGADNGRSVAGWCWIATCESVDLATIDIWVLIGGNLLEGISCLILIMLLIISIFLLHRQEVSPMQADTFNENEISYSLYRHESIPKDEQQNAFSGRWKLLFWIPIAFIVSHLWGACRLGFSSQIRVGKVESGPEVIIDEVLLIFQAIGSNVQPIINLVLFSMFQQHAFLAFFGRSPSSHHESGQYHSFDKSSC